MLRERINRTLDEIWDDCNARKAAGMRDWPQFKTLTIRHGGRAVDVRPALDWSGNFLVDEFVLWFHDPEVNLKLKHLRKGPVKRKQAEHLIDNFLEGVRFDNEDEQGEMFINQAERWVEIVAVKWSRLRLEYELPRSGRTGCWRRHTKLGDVLYVNPEPY